MKLKSFSFLICAMACLMVSFKTDETPLEKLLKQLEKITANFPQEKVHLHIDKPIYAIGEEIWIKAYVVTAQRNEPTLLSGVLNVDLIDAKNEVRKKIRMPIHKGNATGHITLIDSLAAGNYRLRAYTNYMRNYSSSFFFEKTIQIGDAFGEKQQAHVINEDTGVDVQFFPEGGYLVNGIRSKIGVKAVSKNGIGINLTGYISDQGQQKVAEFNTEHAGLGVFAFLPKRNEKYTATVNLGTGGTKSFNLPEVKESGFVLSINEIDSNINLKISATPDLTTGQEVNLLALNNGTVCGAYKFVMNQPSLVTNISKRDFPTGILQFTLFDATNVPIAERLLFVDHQDGLNITTNIPDSAVNTLQKMNFALNICDENGRPVSGNFSISVTDVTKIPFNEDDETTILSDLLLTSDLKGFIEQPNYYFNNVNAAKKRQLNNLLLTQGWRRFLWKDIADNKEPEIEHRIEQSLEITGNVVNLADKPIPNAKVMLFSRNKDYSIMIDTIADAKGRFVFDRLDFPDSVSLFLQAKTLKGDNNIKIKLDAGPDPSIGSGIENKGAISILTSKVDMAPYLELTKAYYDELDKFNLLDKSIRLKTVNIVAKKINPLVSQVKGSQNFSGVDHVVGRDKLKNELRLLDALYRTPGIAVRDRAIYKTTARSTSITGGEEKMLVYINGVLSSQDIIADMRAEDVEGVEVLTSNYNLSVYGDKAGAGILHITMRKGMDVKYPSTNIATVKNHGYVLKKEFYSPNYAEMNSNKQMTDLRSTIFWNAEINTDTQGEANISYYNASTPGKYNVVIEGMDEQGKLGRKTFTYQIK